MSDESKRSEGSVLWQRTRDHSKWIAKSHERFDGEYPILELKEDGFELKLHSESSTLYIANADIAAYWSKLDLKELADQSDENCMFKIATHYVEHYTIF